MPAERDPRVDPVPGDVLRKMTDPILLLITERECLPLPEKFIAGSVAYRISEHGKPRTTTIEAWRKWARNAEVIQRGAENA